MLIPLTIIYLLFGRVVPWSLLVTLTAYVSRTRSFKQALVVSLIGGILEDVVYFKPLGLTAAWLLLMAAVIWFIESHYRSRWPWWWLAALGGEVTVRLVHGLTPWSIPALVGQLISMAAVTWLLLRLKEAEGIYVGKAQ